ncbi:hypothetical protein [Pseudomonas sp.]|uniref:hypothetical protein n=1 Tax=Pseudomonas sp. TaxID=306 RepID=UPI0028AEE21B|nr:hypothetical protein [Pseudomonas sp.]
MRIRGRIGDWPVDLTIELEPEEWAQFGRHGDVMASDANPAPLPAKPLAAAGRDDEPLRAACDLLRAARQLEGPELLERLESLTGSFAAAKRLLVRLRHSAQVRVVSEGDAPVYVWDTSTAS